MTFLIAILLTFPLQSVASGSPLYIAFPLLILVILIGIIFDIVGMGVAVAEESPLNAMAAKRLPGARQALRLTRNADRVSSFCNDVVGDIAGTLSGALGATVAVHVLATMGQGAPLVRTVTNTVLLALVAAGTVGGKALGKTYALTHAVDVTLRAGLVLSWLEYALHREFLGGTQRRKRGEDGR